MKKTILIASVLLSGTAWAEDAKVCFYEDENFLGQKWCTQQLGQQNMPSSMNDKVTAIRLYGNAYVKVYEHGNQGGKSTTVMQDTFLFKRLNDSISSLDLLERTTDDFACLYQDSGYAGTPMCSMAGEGIADMGIADLTNEMSSVFLSGNAGATLYRYPNFNNSSVTLIRSSGNLKDHSFNDEADSFRVHTRQPSTLQEQMAAQNELVTYSPIYKATWMGTHNSYNSGDYYWASAKPNQSTSIVEQLESGVRAIEIDVVGRTLKHKVDTSGTSFVRVMSEIKNWLRVNPGQFIYVKFEHSSKNEGYEQDVAREIIETFGNMVFRDAGNGCNYAPESLTTKQLLDDGKQIMFFAFNGDCGNNTDYRSVIWNRMGPETSDDHDYAAGCPSSLPAWDLGRFSTIVEDKRGWVWDHYLPVSQVRPALECGINFIGRDQFLPDDADGYIANHIFSWRNGLETPRVGRQHVKLSVGSDGYAHFATASQSEQYPALCMNREGQIQATSQAVSYYQAQAICSNEFADSRFTVPTNARELSLFVKSVNEGAQFWMNYRAIGDRWVPFAE
ncbi:phosphatidylinositol-specific phospholipase C domain-containing protein [Photobacterium indicum]|uniref:1-phosphatidylinositol phosphodiesterase n=1 Tax=Photobacterium indicum TaxID=81447 RepID=A0A2T3L156_9GAMM|nr:phosphatidylinositol-specific phospholipase C domain-containing protein [Photobacterium indicum]PSV41982.1 hypothetical protein C9J47_26575 [Photobacterium indicum]